MFIVNFRYRFTTVGRPVLGLYRGRVSLIFAFKIVTRTYWTGVGDKGNGKTSVKDDGRRVGRGLCN